MGQISAGPYYFLAKLSSLQERKFSFEALCNCTKIQWGSKTRTCLECAGSGSECQILLDHCSKKLQRRHNTVAPNLKAEYYTSLFQNGSQK